MRYIPLDEIELPEGWRDEAVKALKSVTAFENASRTERNAEIERNAPKTWRALKNALKKLSNDKCWYCEVRQERSLGAVDHFRPKGKVDGVPSHPGYWWLAFDETNYRFSCTLCNSAVNDIESGTSGGKREQFPLLDETKRASNKDVSHEHESPVLLDPTVAADTVLLTWKVDGKPSPRFSAAQNSIWNKRAEVSIRVYHLHHRKLNRRRIRIYNEIKLLVQEGDLLYGKALSNLPVEMSSVERVTKGLMRILREDAELTSAAKQYVREFMSSVPNRVWLEAVVNAT